MIDLLSKRVFGADIKYALPYSLMFLSSANLVSVERKDVDNESLNFEKVVFGVNIVKNIYNEFIKKEKIKTKINRYVEIYLRPTEINRENQYLLFPQNNEQRSYTRNTLFDALKYVDPVFIKYIWSKLIGHQNQFVAMLIHMLNDFPALRFIFQVIDILSYTDEPRS